MNTIDTAGRQIAQAAIDAAGAGQLARVHVIGFATPLDITSGSVDSDVVEFKNRGNLTYRIALSAIYAMTTAAAPSAAIAKRLDTSNFTSGMY